MKIALPIKDSTPPDLPQVSGHAGQSRLWWVYDCTPGQPLPGAQIVTLDKAQVLHHFEDDGPHPLDGVEIVIAASAGDGFIRHMARRGAQVLLTGESDPQTALGKVLAGEALPDTRFDVTTTLCKLRDMFSRY
jgi:predicted Fe-Mo cluster-binding NifX family protein